MHPHPVAAEFAAAVARRDPPRLAMMLTQTAPLRALLPAAVIVAHGRADVPTHLVVLVLAAASAFWLRRRGRVGSVQAWRVAFVAAIAQPAAHAYGSMLPPDPAPHDGAHLLHILATDGQSAIVQIGLPAMASLVLVTLAYLVELLVHAVRRAPRGHLLPALPPRRVPAVFPPAGDRSLAGADG